MPREMNTRTCTKAASFTADLGEAECLVGLSLVARRNPGFGTAPNGVFFL